MISQTLLYGDGPSKRGVWRGFASRGDQGGESGGLVRGWSHPTRSAEAGAGWYGVGPAPLAGGWDRLRLGACREEHRGGEVVEGETGAG